MASSYFDETFAQDTKAITDLQSAYERDADALCAKLKAVADDNSKFMDMDAFAAVRLGIVLTLIEY